MIPKVSSSDILRAFVSEVPAAEQPAFQRQHSTHADRMELLVQFKECWQTALGDLIELPPDTQFFKWFSISKWDFQLLVMAIEDLRCRVKFGLDVHDPYGHALRHFTAALVRRVRGKYGPPPAQRAA